MTSIIRSRALAKSLSTLSAPSLPRSRAASVTSISSLASTSTARASVFRSSGPRSLPVPSLAGGLPPPSRRDPLARAPCRQTRTNFSYAGPRKLSDILKTELLADSDKSDIARVWTTFHDAKDRVHGLTVDAAQGKSVLSRAAQCPFFLHPVFREQGHYMILSQFQAPNYFLLAYLEDYRTDPARAQPLLTVSVFDDFAEGKDVNLIRCDIISPGIEDDEGYAICKRLLDDYGNDDDFETVHLFNKKPDDFDVDDFVKEKERQWKLLEKARDTQLKQQS